MWREWMLNHLCPKLVQKKVGYEIIRRKPRVCYVRKQKQRDNVVFSRVLYITINVYKKQMIYDFCLLNLSFLN